MISITYIYPTSFSFKNLLIQKNNLTMYFKDNFVRTIKALNTYFKKLTDLKKKALQKKTKIGIIRVFNLYLETGESGLFYLLRRQAFLLKLVSLMDPARTGTLRGLDDSCTLKMTSLSI